MKIFLLNPSSPPRSRAGSSSLRRPAPPLALAKIARALERRGHDIRLLDGDALALSAGGILKEIRIFAPDLLIYSSDRFDAWHQPRPSQEPLVDFFRILGKEPGPPGEILLLGPHGTLLPLALLEAVPAVNYLVRGEPEVKILDFVEALERDEPRSVPGISYRRGNGEVVHNPDPGFEEDLDRLPFPAYHLLPMHRYVEGRASAPAPGYLAVSRGLPAPGPFWSRAMHGPRLRIRSVAKVLEELDLLLCHYKVEKIRFMDPLFPLEHAPVLELIQALVQGRYRLAWECRARLAALEEGVLELMARSGCTDVALHLESPFLASPPSAGEKAEERIRFMDTLALGRKMGIALLPHIYYGLPEDTPGRILDRARFFHGLGLRVRLHRAVPFPGTSLYELGLREGRITARNWEAIQRAAGRVGNDLREEDLARLYKEVEGLNRRMKPPRIPAGKSV